MENNLQNLINDLVKNPYDAINNLKVANEYENLNQIASALSFYLRAAEFSTDPDIAYESLIRVAICIGKSKERPHSEKGAYLNATQCKLDRPEAYFYLSQYEEYRKNWQESYMYACIGLELCSKENKKFVFPHNYTGIECLLFQKALCCWWLGMCDESRKIYTDLNNNYQLQEPYKTLVQNNLLRINSSHPLLTYTKSNIDQLKHKFESVELIGKNYSQAYQDMFVLTMLNGKKNGTYLEIGSADPFYGNNTALLESVYGWKGISIDITEKDVNKFNSIRTNKAIHIDATKVNYSELIDTKINRKDIDYLQIDCDPPKTTFDILLSIPFERYRFAVITYEHDYYIDSTKSYRDKSRRYLISMGYIPVATNISPNEFSPYEDWWIHPDLVAPEIVEKMKAIGPETKKADLYMFGNYNN
jgi:hypothetical protein